jgi:hypothetical protein
MLEMKTALFVLRRENLKSYTVLEMFPTARRPDTDTS